ncbi:GNAT family N-acetyltransferase [Achromobacter arsenitoxydans]|uniref:GNAT family acetyltransferase n=1 Tax=Achromobacter arsenitoxydans SY8 TaxID=477184 RepID=H0F4P7_9BURK|nr:GNAT family N-acetyltransferase [Achromobacter arsenitoxydans]EHK66698.1 GNAT family acetyltransferase [Achromobacter arsenitoxydans SY8]
MDAKDAEAILAMESDAEVMRHSTGLIQPTPESRAALLAYIASDQGKLGHWAITSDSQTAGWISLTPLAGTTRTQVAYRLAREYWGKGLACAALRDVCDYARRSLKLPELAAVVWPANAPSQRLLERAGFEYECMAHHYGRDVMLFSIRF